MNSDVAETCRCALACESLYDTFGPDQVSRLGEEAYDAARAGYWSQFQGETHPKCFFHPTSAEDVSVGVLLSRATQCPFALKGGGHSSFKGASNSDGGITFDFKYMKEVTPSDDRKTVSIGPGNTWFDVYTTLEEFNLHVVGGRLATVGVSGLVLGGGISFHSGENGWACDNMANYEVVLASGEMVNVNATSFPDLYWALRGGGGNFGIVTKFVANAYEQGMMWGGFRYVDSVANNASLTKAFINFAKKGIVEDPKAAVLFSFAYAQIYNMWIQATTLTHPDPQPEGRPPKVFDEWFSIGEPPLVDSTGNRRQSNITGELAGTSPRGMRQDCRTLTVQVDEKLVEDILEIWRQGVEPITNLTAIIPTVTFQLLTPSAQKAMNKNGGNALGIGGGDKPLIIMNLQTGWVLTSDDEAVLTSERNIIERSTALAKERGLFHPFLYSNYADGEDDPISSYGAENKAKLLQVAKKYDPHGVFQKLHPGHFKLDKAS